MIRLISGISELEGALGDKADIYTEKIRSYARAYGFGYDFCRFWVQDGGSAVISAYYSDAVAVRTGEMTSEEAEELSVFLTGSGLHRILMHYPLCEELRLCGSAEKLYVMRYENDIKNPVEYNKEPIRAYADIGKIYEIAAHGFDIDFEKWYTDISHMLRHGISRAYTLEDACCAVSMYSSCGITYLSYICTLPERRGEGLAKRLLRGICAEELSEGSETYIICESGLRRFYENAGFAYVGYAADIFPH